MTRTTVLIADDAADIRTIMSYSLDDLGMCVIEAADGYEAVRLARQHRPALILLDLCMPGIDGCEVAARLRADPALDHVPIIAMTAYDISSVIRAAYLAGCQKVVVKPFDLPDLMQEVAATVARIAVRPLEYAY
jgi:CheY-like chemotaxis protein